MLDAEEPVCVLAGTAAEAERAIRGLRSIGFVVIAGYVLGGGPEESASPASTSSTSSSPPAQS